MCDQPSSSPDSAPDVERTDTTAPAGETCDWCGSSELSWRNCKLLCRTCHAIVKSCADL